MAHKYNPWTNKRKGKDGGATNATMVMWVGMGCVMGAREGGRDTAPSLSVCMCVCVCLSTRGPRKGASGHHCIYEGTCITISSPTTCPSAFTCPSPTPSPSTIYHLHVHLPSAFACPSTIYHLPSAICHLHRVGCRRLQNCAHHRHSHVATWRTCGIQAFAIATRDPFPLSSICFLDT